MIDPDKQQFKPSDVFNETAELKRRKEFSHREVGLLTQIIRHLFELRTWVK
jgi:hypothetical protein